MIACHRTALAVVIALLLTACTTVQERPRNQERIDAFVSVSQRDVLENPDKFEFLTLYPYHDVIAGDERYVIRGTFHRFGILGRAEVRDRALQKKLIEELFDGVSQGLGRGLNCFSPRHAIHVEKADQEVDVLVCVHCENACACSGEDEHFSGLAVEVLTEWRATPAKLGLIVHLDLHKK